MKKLLLTLFLFYGTTGISAAGNYEVKSPDDKTAVLVNTGKNSITYSIMHAGYELVSSSYLSLELADGRTLGIKPIVRKAVEKSVDEKIEAPFYKRSTVEDRYNELTLTFKEGYKLCFRAYDDGVAYRFITDLKGEIVVRDEPVEIKFPEDFTVMVPYVRKRNKENGIENCYFNTFENTYTTLPVSEVAGDHLAFLPVLVDAKTAKIVITEADLEDYPGMFLYNPSGGNSLTGNFAPYPAEEVPGGHNMLQLLRTKRENFIARTKGSRSFPWRVFVIAEHDIELADNDMVYRLASPSRLKDISWIKPGKVAWDWWNDWNLYGVDFKAGINNETYKYYIDFAADNGIEYIILDEGWAVNKQADLFQVIPEIDLPELIAYGRERNVGIVLWAGFLAMERDMERACRHYSEMGVKGFKVDFMDYDDQKITDFCYRMAATAAKYHLFVDLHGVSKPTGLQRTYPNVLNFEGVFGLEQLKWGQQDMVTYDVTMPYIRMIAGPVDYTQGAMRNASRDNYHPVYSEGMSQGTRCRQLAEYIVFESPFNMMCDSPSNYINEAECTRFIADVPTTWDKSIGLDGRVGEYISIARRKKETWYIGGLTDWNPREITVDLSFLDEGTYGIELFRDGINADKAARDYRREVMDLPADRKIRIKMAPGGGFAMKITRR